MEGSEANGQTTNITPLGEFSAVQSAMVEVIQDKAAQVPENPTEETTPGFVKTLNFLDTVEQEKRQQLDKFLEDNKARYKQDSIRGAGILKKEGPSLKSLIDNLSIIQAQKE